MEVNKELHILIERARDLYDKMNDKIDDDSINFCRQCTGQGLLCGIPLMTMEERKGLIAVRDSLKEVKDMLIFLQKLELCHQGNISSGLARLDQSRMYLIERINQYPKLDRKLDVLEELHTCFRDQRTSLNWNLIEKKKKKNEERVKKGVSQFLVTCITSLFSPRIWYHATRFAIKVIVISAGVSSALYIHRNMYRRTLDSTMARTHKFLPADSKSSVAVLRGRG